jgi:hypothetical protein
MENKKKNDQEFMQSEINLNKKNLVLNKNQGLNSDSK